jgi:iron(II)-dependent oxidoreductase
MIRKRKHVVVAAVGVGLVILILGVALRSFVLIGMSIICFAPVAYPFLPLRRQRQAQSAKPTPQPSSSPAENEPKFRPVQPPARKRKQPRDPDAYVDWLIEQGRHMLLVRPQIADNLRRGQLQTAIKAMHESMALVPEGEVLMAQPDMFADEKAGADGRGQLIAVEAFFLDRYPVTNQKFKDFVDSGGYEDSSLWSQSVLAGVINFVDQTGQVGPRFWRDGTFASELADHPVVGVSWYEADAFARWAGKRLPTDAEWVKAGSWPVPAVGGGPPQQRRYPWGNAMDNQRANLSASGLGRTAAVFDYTEGVSPGGVYQLIGNVWEWTSEDFGVWHAPEQMIDFLGYKSLRGGAFDTYIDSHAVCQFQSGDNPLARKHNIGFRCALGMCDIVPAVLEVEA